jgi:uncharacterized membrane protein
MVRKQPVHKKHQIAWRSHEPSRLETFSDAAFAFAITLIIVSLEVPKSFNELYETMKGAVSFAVCFALIFQIWNSQNLFFRKYGLKDSLTTILNGMLLFVVLMYAYPLKFLSVLLFGTGTYMHDGVAHRMIETGQTSALMVIYGTGYSIIYGLFFLMHLNALKHAEQIKLTPPELFQTKTDTYINLFSTLIGLLAITLALALPSQFSGLSGFTYCLIAIVYSVWYGFRGKKARRLFPD